MPPRPNILFILSDDQGAWALGCAGNGDVRTPNLDRLAAKGVRFDNFFCASPVCSPARASIATGSMPSAHGVHDWLRAGDTLKAYEPDGRGELTEYLAGQVSYTDHLAEHGYVCGLSGKWHLGDSHHAQKSYSFWRAHAKGGGSYYHAPMVDGDAVYEPEAYVTDLITDQALEFLEKHDRKRPFYLGVHYTAPHSPWGREQHPTHIWDDYLANCAFEATPVEGKHPWAGNGLWPKSARDRREKLSGYYTAITEMDRNIGRLLDWLEDTGLRENTLVAFTSDNGMNMGHHGLYGKGNASFPQNMYDTSVKVPALLSQPGKMPQGQICPAMLSHYDLFPTFLDVAGIEADMPHLPGRSFLPLLRGENGAIRDDVIIQSEYGPVRMIRTREWKYIHRYPYGPNELYDLTNDPGECFNLAERPEQHDRIQKLLLRMENWFDTYSDCALDGRTQPVTGLGQLEKLGGQYRAAAAFTQRA